MKNPTTKSIILSVVIGVLFAVSMSYVYAAWSNPSSTPTGGNLEAPVHENVGAQAKAAGLSVDTFAALGNASLLQNAYFRGQVRGIQPGSATPVLKIGGMNALGTNYIVTANVQGDVKSSDKIGSSELANTSMKTLCGDDKGHVLFCAPPVAVSGAIACNVQQTGSYGPSLGYHKYADMIYDLNTTSGTMNFQYDSHDVPNRFSVYKYSDGSLVYTTGWVGQSSVSGPWGQTLPWTSAYRGTIPLTITERYYRVLVETSTSAISDAWDANLLCP